MGSIPVVGLFILKLLVLQSMKSVQIWLSTAVTLTLSLALQSNCLAESLKIGYIGSLTGDAAAIGTEIANVLRVSVDEINESGGISGRNLELVIEDDGYEVKRTLSAYEKLKTSINSHVIFMSSYGGLFALGKRPERDGIVLVDTLDCNDDIVKISRMHTCVATRTESIGEALVEKIELGGGGKVGVLYEQEAWFNFTVDTLRKRLGPNLVEVIASVQSGDYQAEVLKLKSSEVKHVVFLGNESMGKAIAQARSTGLQAQFYSIASATSPGFKSLAGTALNGAYISNWLIPRNDIYVSFASDFKSRNGREIGLEFVAGPTHDAATLTLNVLRKLYATNSEVTGSQIRKALADEIEFDGISGRIKMDSDGAVKSIREKLFRYDEGKLVDLK